MLQGSIDIAPHPLLVVRAFTTSFAEPLARIGTAQLEPWLSADADAPLERSEEIRQAVRDMLRHGGYKPTGRGKPASEYLVRAASEGALATINAAVDACNAVSLHSGLPVSVVDLDRLAEPLSIAIAPAGTRYVFNAGGQEIDVGGLVCLHDATGPCANPVKDAQRTKTTESTRNTLSIVWGVAGAEERLTGATAWYRDLLTSVGGTTEPVAA